MNDLHGLAIRRVSSDGKRFHNVCNCGYRTPSVEDERGARNMLRKHMIRHGATIKVFSSMTGQARFIPVASKTIRLVRPKVEVS